MPRLHRVSFPYRWRPLPYRFLRDRLLRDRLLGKTARTIKIITTAASVKMAANARAAVQTRNLSTLDPAMLDRAIAVRAKGGNMEAARKTAARKMAAALKMLLGHPGGSAPAKVPTATVKVPGAASAVSLSQMLAITAEDAKASSDVAAPPALSVLWTTPTAW